MVRIRSLWNSFKDVAILISFITNFILIIVLLFVGLLIFQIKNYASDQLITGLYKSFVGLDSAHIITNINVNDPALPVKLNIPLNQDTTVVLTSDVQISRAQTSFTLGDGTTLHGVVTITLPKGLSLPVALNLSVPVDSSIPINLNVPVDIPLDKTQLHDPFSNLRSVLRPYVRLLNNLPNSWSEVPGFAANVLAGKVNLNQENDTSQNPWPGFCTGLPTPPPNQPLPTAAPYCVTPGAPAGTAISPAPGGPTPTLPPFVTPAPGSTAFPTASAPLSGGGSPSGNNPPPPTPTLGDDFGIITATPKH